MTSILNEFPICEKIPQNIKINIKSFYVFKTYEYVNEKYIKNNNNIIFVTKEDKVYCLGGNDWGVFGLGHNQPVNEITEITELSNQKIIVIYNGNSYVLGRNEENKLFGWGWNHYGQLGRGEKSENNCYLKPQEINFPFNENIIDICCGGSHTLVLLTNGLLYGWGWNKWGQLGLHKEEIIDKPVKLEINAKNDLIYRYIYCSGSSSFAITINGDLFSWGYNHLGILGQGVNDKKCIPRLISLNNIQKVQICFNTNYDTINSYFLTKEGSIYYFGSTDKNGSSFKNVPAEIKSPNPISNYLINLFTKTNYQNKDFPQFYGQIYDIAIFIEEDNDYNTHRTLEKHFYTLEYGRFKMLDENYDSLIDLFAKRFGITPQMLNISNNGTRHDLHTIERRALKKYKVNSSEPIENFEFISEIGTGGFGIVNKYKYILDQEFYAIKIINIQEAQQFFPNTNDFLREVQVMAKTKSKFVVHYNHSWIENNYLFIQMEFCSQNLKQILENKPKIFERSENQAMNSIEYFISCEIFRQITEALNYLHSLKPIPVIHRDLKPDNILIGLSDHKLNCKISDFGLSKFIDNNPNTRRCGPVTTPRYCAPEVLRGQDYDNKADVYSLGIIGFEIFCLDSKSNKNIREIYENSGFVEKIGKILETIQRELTIISKDERISAKELLEVLHNWTIDKNVIKSDDNYDYFLTKCREESEFFYDILDT